MMAYGRCEASGSGVGNYDVYDVYGEAAESAVLADEWSG